MKLYIFTPNRKTLFKKTDEDKLDEVFDVVFYSEVKPLEQCQEIINDGDEKIVAIDPDFFDWNFGKDKLALLKNVKAIILQTTSFGWVDTVYAKSKNIPIMNLRGFSGQSVAEYAVMLALGVSRKLPLLAQDNYKQDFVKHQGIELCGKKVGIVGLGDIGGKIGMLMSGFNTEISYWSRNHKNNGFIFKNLEQVFRESDVIFITIAQNTETEKLITDNLLKEMRKGAILVSIARKSSGKMIYNHDLVVTMVQNGQLFGYGYEEDNGDPTAISGNTYTLPSMAWVTKESMSANVHMWIDSIIKASKDVFINNVNE